MQSHTVHSQQTYSRLHYWTVYMTPGSAVKGTDTNPLSSNTCHFIHTWPTFSPYLYSSARLYYHKVYTKNLIFVKPIFIGKTALLKSLYLSLYTRHDKSILLKNLYLLLCTYHLWHWPAWIYAVFLHSLLKTIDTFLTTVYTDETSLQKVCILSFQRITFIKYHFQSSS